MSFPVTHVGSLDLSTVCEDARIEDMGGAGFNDPGFPIPHRPGLQYDPEASFLPLDLMLRVILIDANPDAKLSSIKAQLSRRGLVEVKATYPGIGDVRAMCKQVGRTIKQGDPVVYTIPLSAPSGSWQDQIEQSEGPGSPPSVTTGGDREIHDPIIVFAAAGTFTYTDTSGVQHQIVASAGPTFPVTVDVGAGTILDSGGGDARDAVTFTQPWWMRFDADDTLNLTSTSNVTVKWRDRYA